LKKVEEGEMDIPDPDHGVYTTNHHENIIAQDGNVESFGQHISHDG
jgi:ribosomal protein L31